MQISNNEITFGGGEFGYYDEDYVIQNCARDVNWCLEPGIYYLPRNTINAATTTKQTMFVIRVNDPEFVEGAYEIHQIFYLAGLNPIYKRYRDRNGTWHQWYEINFIQLE